jgi:hypothetical protein
MPVVDQLALCNRAIGRIRAKRMQSLSEQSLEARESNTYYPAVISEMLDGPFDHNWSFANVRAILAQKAVNDRSYEWAFAYALPSNMGSPIRVIPNFEGLGIGSIIALPGDPYTEAWALQSLQWETPYVIEGSTLYSNFENAALEYAINDITDLNVSPKIELAIELDLAARLAVPVKGDSNREKELSAAASLAWERAIADDRNRHPQHMGQYTSEALMARRGYLPEAI